MLVIVNCIREGILFKVDGVFVIFLIVLVVFWLVDDLFVGLIFVEVGW